MDFDLTEDQLLVRESVRTFLAKECSVEYVRRCDEEEVYPAELFAKMAKLGWWGIPIATEYGGSGGSCMDLVLFLEELAYRFEASANIFYTSIVIASEALRHFGSEAQKREFSAQAGQRGDALRLLLVRAEFRLRCGLAAHTRGARWR